MESIHSAGGVPVTFDTSVASLRDEEIQNGFVGAYLKGCAKLNPNK